jgi:hypothetical protein
MNHMTQHDHEQNHTSTASGVAYAESRGATEFLNWTEVGPKLKIELISRQLRFILL